MFADLIDIHVFHCTCISFIVKRLENFLICAIKDHIIIIIISNPTEHLPTEEYVAGIKCYLYYKGQPKVDKPMKCKNCLQIGHLAATCENDVVCLDCGVSGHKRGQCGLEDIQLSRQTLQLIMLQLQVH